MKNSNNRKSRETIEEIIRRNDIRRDAEAAVNQFVKHWK
jgi:hypothetical protein